MKHTIRSYPEWMVQVAATTANKDSVKEKEKEKAVEKALDFLKKKIK